MDYWTTNSLKYKVGDKVKIIPRKEATNVNKRPHYIKTMNDYSGRVATITKIHTSFPDCYFIDIDGGNFKWNGEWLEKVLPDPTPYLLDDKDFEI